MHIFGEASVKFFVKVPVPSRQKYERGQILRMKSLSVRIASRNVYSKNLMWAEIVMFKLAIVSGSLFDK